MKIVADENIPFIKEYFGEAGELILKPGRQIYSQDLKDADMLLVRSVTHVNATLLEGSSVKFVGSATTGWDHIDIDYLNAKYIDWQIAKGCNQTAVVEYVLSVLASLQSQGYLNIPKQLRAAVIGVGNIGSIVSKKLKLLGFNVIECDPLRALVEPTFSSTPLEQIKDVDLISLHTPLTHTGKFPTFHLIEKTFLQRQKAGCVLLNTSRGSVIDFSALKKYGTHLHWCLDVWENEPHIDEWILQKAVVATPHIAGYSIQSKLRGIAMIYDAFVKQHFIVPQTQLPNYAKTTLSTSYPLKSWQDVMLLLFDPKTQTQQMKKTLLKNAIAFDDLRKQGDKRFEVAFVDFENFQLNAQECRLLDVI